MEPSTPNSKPTDAFYICYPELCRRMNCVPSRVIKAVKPKNQTILEFVGDRLKVDEWIPILNALRSDTSLQVIRIKSKMENCPFLHDIDTEEKAKKMTRRFGSLWTTYVLHQLTKSISTSLKNTNVLTVLELDGLPMYLKYLETLLKALKKNKTVKHLSFGDCAIKDEGCEILCKYLQQAPHVEVLNLSGCQLSSNSGEYLAKLIKFQQINRYCESWHNSLRYEDPQRHNIKGIKRITINRNSNFQDDGFDFILNELKDDLWIKALDLQRCGITEKLSSKIFDVVAYNRSLEIVDLRHNNLLNLTTVEKVLQLLRQKRDSESQSEFQWCGTNTSLASTSYSEFASNSLIAIPVHKTKSMTSKSSARLKSCGTQVDMDVKTTTNLRPTTISDMNIKIQTEIQKRKLLEKENKELQEKLNKLLTTPKVSTPQKNGLKKLSTPTNSLNRAPPSEKNGLKKLQPEQKFDFKNLPTLHRIFLERSIKRTAEKELKLEKIISSSLIQKEETTGKESNKTYTKNHVAIKKNKKKMENKKENEYELLSRRSVATNSDSTNDSLKQSSSASKIFAAMLNNDENFADSINEYDDVLEYLRMDQCAPIEEELEEEAEEEAEEDTPIKLSAESQNSIFEYMADLSENN